MQRRIHIVRDDVELTALSEAEVRELLREGFLLPSDHYWAEGMPDSEELGKLGASTELQSRSGGLMNLARQTTSSTSRTAAAQVSRLTRRLQILATRGKSQISDSTNRLLDSFTPQIQRLVAHQLVNQSMTRMQAAVRDDEFMCKLFGATYDRQGVPHLRDAGRL